MLKTILTLLLPGMLLIACRSTQKFHASDKSDKPLFAAINELNKRPNNAKAQADLIEFYKQAVERHEDAIDAYRNSNDIRRWDNILAELNSLQHIYNSIQATPNTFSLVRPKNYVKQIEDVKAAAAEDYYNYATAMMARPGRQNSLEAYQAFKKVNTYLPGYRETRSLMQEAYEKSVVNIVINPIEDDNIFFSRWNDWTSDFRYRPEDLQEMLVRDLGGTSSDRFPARFYTDRQARRSDVDVDWVVNSRWSNIEPVRSIPNQYSRQVSKSIQIGKDTSGKPVYQTVYATVHITNRNMSVRGNLDYRIVDIENNSTVNQGYLTEEVFWDESFATYTGDSRALSQDDWRLINNRNAYNNVSRSEILNTLMRKMYPDIRRRIEYALN